MENAFTHSTDSVVASLGVDPVAGLTEDQVVELRAKHGKNGENRIGPPPHGGSLAGPLAPPPS